MIDVIAFDGDDTLWHCERLYAQAADKFKRLFSGHPDPERVGQMLSEIEIANLSDYGYGFKSFALSMIETAIEVSNGPVPGDLLRQTIDIARQIQTADVQLMDIAEETLTGLSATYPLMLITKGEFIEQTRKVKGSGLEKYFRSVEIVGEKSVGTYQEVIARHHVNPGRFLMIGDSLRSDVMPVIELGGMAVHIPSSPAWSHEALEASVVGKDRYYEIERLPQVPALVGRLNRVV